MSSSQDQGRLLDLVRREIGCDTTSFPESDLKSFLDFIQSDEDGKLALNALLDPKAHLQEQGIPIVDYCDTSGFKKSTPAFVSLTGFGLFSNFRLIAEEIGKIYKANLKTRSPYRSAQALDDQVKGALYYDDKVDLEGYSSVMVKEWVLEPHYTPHQTHSPPKVEYPLCAGFYGKKNGKIERIACFVSELASALGDNNVAILSGAGEWCDIEKGKPFLGVD